MTDARPMDGVLLLDKPAGMSSFDVIRRLRKPMQRAKMGHTGTLDPMATGVLVVCVGWSTRLVPYLTAADKTYDGAARLGIETDTDDREGEAIAVNEVPPLTLADIDAACDAFRGEIDQVPPAYSAVHIDGERAYAAARRGDAVDIPARRVHVRSLDVDAYEAETLTFRVDVSKGTYVRSLARDLGRALGCGAHLTALRRTAAGPLSIERCVPLHEVIAGIERGEAPRLVSPWDALSDMPVLEVDDVARAALRVGQRPVVSPPAVAAPRYRVANEHGELLAIARVDDVDGTLIAVSERVRPGA